MEKTLEGPFSPGIAGRVMSYADEEPPSPTSNGLYDTPPYSLSHSPTSQIIDDSVVTIILHPDEDGKYGFNIKGKQKKIKIIIEHGLDNKQNKSSRIKTVELLGFQCHSTCN